MNKSQSTRKILTYLSKNKLRSYKNEYWYIPAKEDPEFIACMHDNDFKAYK